jgi:neurocalcin delta
MTDADPDTIGDDPLGRTRDIFNKMDVNNDGVLSKEEFINGCLKDETLFNLLACSGVDT